MRKEETMKTSVETRDKKKFYSAPKLEMMDNVRKLTQGGGDKANDMGSKDVFGQSPSDPGSFPP